MPLCVYNLTSELIQLAGMSVTVAPSANPPARGPANNVNSELRGLTSAQYQALEDQRAGSLVYEWQGAVEYDVSPLSLAGKHHPSTDIPFVQTVGVESVEILRKHVDPDTLLALDVVICGYEMGGATRCRFMEHVDVYRPGDGSPVIESDSYAVPPLKTDVGLDISFEVDATDLIVKCTGIAGKTLKWSGSFQN